MGKWQFLPIMACALAILLTYSSAFPKVKTKTSPQERAKPKEKLDSKVKIAVREKSELDRKARALRPSFVKRSTQAPILHAGDEKIDDEYIVKLRDDLTVEELAEFEEKLQALCEDKGLHIEFQLNITALLKGFVAKVPKEALDILRWMDEVEYVEEDEVVHATALPWGLDRIDQADLPLDNVYSSSPLGDGSGVSVFVLDTGIRYTHVEFGQRAKFFYDAFNDGYNGNDCQGHGTHCAGTIGGNTVGVAPGVTLYAGRVLSCSGNGATSGIVGAMDAVAASGIKPAVVSMSLGGGFSTSLNQAAGRLTNAGYILVVAAGNDAIDACSMSPASAPEAITVGATTSSDSLASYSNYGRCVNILAPGSSVNSAYISGDSSYVSLSGTSMATPHVAGVAALLLQQNPSLSQGQMVSILTTAAESGKISQIPDNSTPNKLLHIPGDANPLPSTDAPQPPTNGLCENTCTHHGDGECDDGGEGALYDVCDLGTDCDDCGPRHDNPTTLCENTCPYFEDGECDDGGPGSHYSVCGYGTDCADCGPRLQVT
ncbi:extracellular serine proteinase-like [Ptychodera flava]|uniref:extracellular serine proteinase-like n=1 Tax=Ptychodera flava TaxID=63121 RepID=UPI00396A3DF5